MTKSTIITSIIVAVLLIGFGVWAFTRPASAPTEQPPVAANTSTGTNTSTNTPPPMSEPTTPTPPSNSDACVRNFDEKVLANAKVETKNREVTLDIKNYGQIVLGFYESDAPKTVENFLRLTNSGFYNCVSFHRVIKGFMIQGGDPTGTGSGGQSAFGAKFEDELNPMTTSYKTGYKRGVLAMANAGPNTNGSQFFIMHQDYPLPNAYTIFGHVIKGQDVVDKIATSETGPSDRPVTPVVIQSAKITK